MEMTQEVLAKARTAKTPDELLTFAKENGEELTAEEAKAYFAQLNPKTGELNDEQLDNVSGGACYAKDGRMVVSALNYERCFCCKKCGGHQTRDDGCSGCGQPDQCRNCKWCTYEKGLWLCNNPKRMK